LGKKARFVDFWGDGGVYHVWLRYLVDHPEALDITVVYKMYFGVGDVQGRGTMA
jgi:hypothetical protein